METRRPLIVDVKRGSLEDGPGIRSVVFFKGCPMRCIFCHNPEAQEPGPEIAFAKDLCLNCGTCARICPLAAINLSSPSRVDRRRCDLCGRCTEACPRSALRLIGKYWPLESLVELLLRDLAFYRHSGGGVTLSGGECTMFADYVEPLLQMIKAHDIHVALETSGCFEYVVFASRILPYVDLVFFDLKIMDRSASVRYLGRSNDQVLNNLRKLLGESSVDVRPRIPLIPGVTDSRDNLTVAVEFLCSVGAKTVSLVPYNPLGLAMYAHLGKPTPGLPSGFIKPAQEKQLFELFREIVDDRVGQFVPRPAAEVACDDIGSRARPGAEPTFRETKVN